MVNLLLFPGQGSQKVGMAKDLAERFPEARNSLAAIDEALGAPLTRIMWDGPDDTLQRTVNTQPAILAHSVAVLAVVGSHLGPTAGAAGHSLGEYGAYVAAGTLTPVAAAMLVRRRGALMYEAGQQRPGSMAAVLGLGAEAVRTACLTASNEGSGVAVAANVNGPDQVVISGDPDAVSKASEHCKAAGARRVIPLKVSGAFHSPLMAPAVEGLRNAIDAIVLSDPAFPVVANASAEPVTRADDAAQLLIDQLTAPVRWVECVERLASLAPGARFIEIGPGNVLGGLLKRIVPNAQYRSLGTAEEVERFLG